MAAVGGFYQALKKLSHKTLDHGGTLSGTPDAGARLAGATLLENVTLAMWSESNRAVVKAVEDNTEASRDHCAEMKELRFQIIRLIDKLG